MKILGLDLGLSKSVFCQFDTLTGEVGFGNVATDQAALRKLFEKRRPERVVIEICPLAAMVHDLAVELGLAVQVADTRQDAWCWKNVKRKTDQDDALKLARLSALGQINCVHIPAVPLRQRRKLIEHRQTLVAERTRCKNRIRALLLPEGVRPPRGKSGWTLKQLELLRKEARPLSECADEQLWRGMLQLELQRLDALSALLGELDAQLDALGRADPRTVLVRTIPGVGWRTAEAIVVALDDARRFQHRRQVAAYAGLTPRRYQSGQMDRQGRISQRGNPLLRQMLNQAAWAAIRHSPRFRAFFLRISGGRAGRRKKAIVAVMHKLLVVAWAMLRDGRQYRAAPPAAAA